MQLSRGACHALSLKVRHALLRRSTSHHASLEVCVLSSVALHAEVCIEQQAIAWPEHLADITAIDNRCSILQPIQYSCAQ